MGLPRGTQLAVWSWTTLACICLVPVSQCQTSDTRLYLLHFMTVSKDRTADVMQNVYVSSFQDTRVRLEIPMANVINYEVLDASNDRSFEQLFVEDLGVESTEREFITHSAATLAADHPVWVHGNKMEQGTTAAFLALPVTQHSTEFFIASYVAPGSTSTTAAFHSGFAVAGLQDGTCLEIYSVTGDNYNRLGLYHLDANDVFTAMDSTADFDYHGYYVNSTRPISVFSGHECAYVSKNIPYCDAVGEQLPPTVEWGTHHIIGPIGGRTNPAAGYEYRVIAKDNDTTVTYTSSAGGTFSGNVVINRGQNFYSGETPSSLDTVVVDCDKKCLVTQYNPSQTKVSGETTKTDPYMVIIPPTDHYDNNIRFVTMKHYNFGVMESSHDWITVIASTPGRDGIRLDGAPLSGGTWVEVAGDTSYSYYYTNIPTTGFHTLTHTDSNEEYMLWVYGHGTTDNTAYGYMGAYKITDTPVSDVSYDLVEPTTQEPVTTAAPWVLANWTSDFTTEDLPIYGIRFQSKFYVQDRDSKVIEKVCSDGYRDFFQKKRLPAMAAALMANMTKICPGLVDSDITLSGGKDFYTVYTHGQVDFLVLVVGSPFTSFRKVEDCIDNIKSYVNVPGNWPAVPSQVGNDKQDNNPTTKGNFMSRDGGNMKDCEQFELWYGTSESDALFDEVKRAWICNGNDPEDILQIIDGASQVCCLSAVKMCAAILVFHHLLTYFK